ncbi:putative signal transducing protein [Pontibacter harenae]|uniref:putative signal transducing protein n=1 Tax=Pontibacter harenae TaxID=2894083 RepID=UPI001E59E155|nr:DUF2007 domain-containing protein [Pontibacter harenae]MCC9167662.1 DUF2007 domain-containing protein [Pontibacter harenae]
MSEKLVTIATYNDPTEAHILKGRLEAEGIVCFLGDEHIVGAHPFYAVAVGGVKLKVLENDAEEARTILEQIQSGNNEYLLDNNIELAPVMQAHPAEEVCPNCGSEYTVEEKYSKTAFSLSYLILGFPIPFLNRNYKCSNCGFFWKAKK